MRNLLQSLLVLTCLLFGCVQTQSLPNYCGDFGNESCICKGGLEKVETRFGQICINMSCEMVNWNQSCIHPNDCPSNHTFLKLDNGNGYSFYTCYKSDQKLLCDDFPSYEDCYCPKDTLKRGTFVGNVCSKDTCEGYDLDGACVDTCPEGYEPARIFDSAGNPNYCDRIENIPMVIMGKITLMAHAGFKSPPSSVVLMKENREYVYLNLTWSDVCQNEAFVWVRVMVDEDNPQLYRVFASNQSASDCDYI